MSKDSNSKETASQPAQPRSAAANALMAVVFLLIVFVGIAIAVYSSRYVPMAINTFTSVNPITGLPNSSSTPAQLAVVPGSSIPFDSISSASTSTTMFPSSIQGPYGVPNVQTVPAETPAPVTAAAYSAPVLHGLSDLNVKIIAAGYLANASNDSFVAAPVIPVGARAAVEFSIGNTGTNATGPWAFTAQIPTDNGYTFNSPAEPSLNPGDHTVFTLAFDQVPAGPAEMITIVADPNNYIPEITKMNNVAVTSVSVVGS